MRFTVAGPDGETVAAGRDAAILRKVAPTLSRETVPDKARRRWEREDITDWDFGDLPESITTGDAEGGGQTFFPALVRRKTDPSVVGLKLFNTHEEALQQHRDGVAALLAIALAADLRYLKRQLRLPAEAGPKGALPGRCQGF